MGRKKLTEEEQAVTKEKRRAKQIEYNRQWRASHPELVRETRNKWQAANIHRVREYKRQWAQTHREYIKEHTKARSELSPEELEHVRKRSREYMRQYTAANPDRVHARQKEWRRTHPEEWRACRQRYHSKPEVKEHIAAKARQRTIDRLGYSREQKQQDVLQFMLKVLDYHNHGFSQEDIAQILGKEKGVIQRTLSKAKSLGYETHLKRRPSKEEYAAIKTRVIELKASGYKYQFIANLLGIPYMTVAKIYSRVKHEQDSRES